MKTRRSTRRKIDIFQKGLTDGCGPKMAAIPTFFKGNIGQENVFHYILERRNAFLRYKNKKFKQSKIHLIPRGLTHGFGPLIAFFKLFFLGNIGQENVFHDILERKNAFLGYKKAEVEKVEKLTFF